MIAKDLKRFVKIPTLYTDRLILRRFGMNDLEDVFEYSSDPSVPEYLLWSAHPTIGYTKSYLSLVEKKYRAAEFYDWGIEYCGHMIGTCGFTSFSVDDNKGELGYVLNKRYWGLGIATEAAKRVMKFGFSELSLNRIESRFIIENKRSLRVMEKCHMTLEGVMREGIRARGVYRDIGISAITASEYFSIRSKGMF